ncbi:hypothetical protein [Nocardia sp. NBC_00511]|uniref:hypothetical protein n=1 Tax=Nocardia sp. NBC_00511 TaxID=2903591 RepID=UPI0030E21473
MTDRPSVVSHDRGKIYQAMMFPGTVESMLTVHVGCELPDCGRLAQLLEICSENRRLGNPGWDFAAARTAAARLAS